MYLLIKLSRMSVLCLLSLLCLLSCGIEAVLFIDYIPPGDYRNVNEATVRLPSSSADGYSTYFEYFVIFYRIYISDTNLVGRIDDTNRSSVNSQLNSDYNGLYSYTDYTSTTVNTSNLENIFNNRRYYKLALADDVNINSVLGSGSLDSTLQIIFPSASSYPTLRINGTSYTLFRATEGPGISFVPKPNRYFLNHPDLCNGSNAVNPAQSSTEINADAYGNTGTDTYVSMYIAAVGRDYLTTIYSQPTFLGIFKLPNAS